MNNLKKLKKARLVKAAIVIALGTIWIFYSDPDIYQRLFDGFNTGGILISLGAILFAFYILEAVFPSRNNVKNFRVENGNLVVSHNNITGVGLVINSDNLISYQSNNYFNDRLWNRQTIDITYLNNGKEELVSIAGIKSKTGNDLLEILGLIKSRSEIDSRFDKYIDATTNILGTVKDTDQWKTSPKRMLLIIFGIPLAFAVIAGLMILVIELTTTSSLDYLNM